ncbi:MAG TPA: hypothetical protein VHV27_03875 [Phenylobacterium sp.]|nr:hypothetical protein [Phenylobacterium sp.]
MIAVLMAAMTLAAADTPPSGGAAVSVAAPAPAAKPKPKGSQMVCWEEQITGSHYPHRICETRDEVEARQRADQEAIAQHGRASTSGGFGASSPH